MRDPLHRISDAAGVPAVDSHPPPTPSSPKPALLDEAALLAKLFWTVPETAFMCRVGVRTVWRLMADPVSKFPAQTRIRGRTLLSRDDVLAYLQRLRKPTR